MLKIKVRTIFEATPILKLISDQRRPMSQAGKFRVARMHAVLLPEYLAIVKERDAIIEPYGYHPMIPKDLSMRAMAAAGMPVPEGTEMIEAEYFAVPPDKIADWNEKWNEMADEEVEVNINPIPISMLSPAGAENGSIEISEIASLDELVTDVVVATNLAQAAEFWSLRESISEAQAAEGKNIKPPRRM